ncbi:hypothetical protein FACS1894216_11390 [Synergistales bacterium]|nr:hypothetical protein FACS1894216_11390 [Synergistales bacterium]
MKYGLWYFKNTRNIGDDIWAYAQFQFYPHIDYLKVSDYLTLHRFVKKTRETPPSEIEQAKRELADWKGRNL